MSMLNRRNFVATVLGGLLAFGSIAARAADDGFHGLKVGLASYSVNKMSFDELVALLKDLDLHYVSLKDVHLKLTTPKEEIQAKVKQLKDAGVTVVSGGVIYMKDDAAARAAFEYAKTAGMPTMVVSFDPSLLPTIEKLVKEYDIKIAIHNHGPGDKSWPSVITGYEKIKDLDPRIGFCVDIGHVFRQGEDIVKALHTVRDRMFDCHFKDYHKTAEGKFETKVLGQGDMDLKGALKELLANNYAGNINLEYEKTGPNEAAELKACFDALKKMLSEM